MNQVDISQIADDKKLETIINSYKTINDGEELIIINNESLLSLIENFQNQFWGEYDWQPLVSGPESWKGKIIKRNSEDVISENIKHFMEIDHSRCDQLYADGEAAILDEQMQVGKELIEAFILNMGRHFDMEEKIFFPAFEERTGMTQGPTQVMRMEHQQMRNVLTQMKDALVADDSETVLSAGETLLILMQQHNLKEEGMLYPMADGQISDISEALLKKMQLIRT
jgi:uncharacterized protein (DUF2249 family)